MSEMFNLDNIQTKPEGNINKLLSQSLDLVNSFNLQNMNDSFTSQRSMKNLNVDTIKLTQD